MDVAVVVMDSAKIALDFFVADDGVLTKISAGLADLDQAIEVIETIPLGCLIADIILLAKSGFDFLIKSIFDMIDPNMGVDTVEDFLDLIIGYGQDISNKMGDVRDAAASADISVMENLLSFSASFEVASGPGGSSLDLEASAAFFGFEGDFELSLQTEFSLQDFIDAACQKIIETLLPVVDWVKGAVETVTDEVDNIMSKLVLDCKDQCQRDFKNVWNNGVKPIADGFLFIIEGLGIVFNYILTGVQFVIDFVDNVIGGLEQHGGVAGQLIVKGLQVHENIASAVQTLLGLPAKASDKAACIVNNGAGKLCQYAATLDGFNAAIEVLKSDVTQTLQDLNFPSLDDVGFSLDFSDIANPAVALSMTLCNDETGNCNVWGFSIGGAGVRRARKAANARHAQRGRRRSGTQSKAILKFRQRVFAFAQSSADSATLDANSYDRAAEVRHARLGALLDGAAGAGNRTRRGTSCDDSSSGDMFWSAVDQIAPQFSGLQETIEPLEDAFNEIFADMIDTFENAAAAIPECAQDSHCSKRCTGAARFESSIVNVDENGRPETYTRQNCFCSINAGLKCSWERPDGEACRWDKDCSSCWCDSSTYTCRGKASVGQYCGGAGTVTTTNNQHCVSDKCGQYSNNDYKCCSSFTAVKYSFLDWCKGLSKGQACEHDAQCSSGWCGGDEKYALSGGDQDDKKDLGVCTGECENGQCAVGLICKQRNDYWPIPGCEWGGVRHWDYCYDPAYDGTKKCQAKALVGHPCGSSGKNSYCSNKKCGQHADNNFRCCSRMGVPFGATQDWCYDLPADYGCKYNVQCKSAYVCMRVCVCNNVSQSTCV